jgi:hypothetical protein
MADSEQASALVPMPRDCASRYAHPLFAGFACDRDEFSVGDLAALNNRMSSAGSTRSLRFVAQTPDLLVDGLHYEERIARRGVIATREGSTHDFFNALVWLRHADLKRAMNVRQVADIARVGPKRRTRGQCALTHFDEAGLIVWLDETPDLEEAWNAHDWRSLFFTHRGDWGSRIAVTVIGHALLDHAFLHGLLPTAKALAVRVDRDRIERRSEDAVIASWPEAERAIARHIEAARLLTDPQELRPLPLAGIPGWQAGQSEAFYDEASCFRPLRAGRCYPPPWDLPRPKD